MRAERRTATTAAEGHVVTLLDGDELTVAGPQAMTGEGFADYVGTASSGVVLR